MAEHANKEPTMEEILSTIRRIISEDDEVTPQTEASAAVPEPANEQELDEAAELTGGDPDAIFDPLDEVAEEKFEAAPVELEADVDLPPTIEAVQAALMSDFTEPEAFEAPGGTIDNALSGITEIDPEADEVALQRLPQDEEGIVETNEISGITPVSDIPSDFIEDPTPETEPEAETPMAVTAVKYDDTTLTEDTTATAAAGSLAKLISGMEFGGENTIEGLVRELLRPMVKEWLDVNLPRIVEEKVEAEVQRIAKMVR